MTEFFSNFGKKISNVGQETVKKTKEIAEISKISSKIKDEEKKLDGLYTELGKKYFSLYSRNQVDRKSTRLNSSHRIASRMPSSA